MKVTVEAPWTNGEEEFKGMLGFIQQTKQQLLFYKSQGNNSDHINKDINGYDELLKSKSEDNVRKFMEIKQDIRCGRSSLNLTNNMEIVEHIKKIGEWK